MNRFAFCVFWLGCFTGSLIALWAGLGDWLAGCRVAGRQSYHGEN